MTKNGQVAVKRALISVSDKTGVQDFARGLQELGVEIVSTGGTATALQDAGIPVTTVEQVTRFPEMLGGRVKTMHPHIMAGLLADQQDAEHVYTIDMFDIEAFQLLVVNLYPYEATVESGADVATCIENIDIGGPTMLRAAAKNHGSVAVVTDPDLYGDVLEAVQAGGFTLAQRQRYMVDVFRHTAEYDIAVATSMAEKLTPEDGVNGFPSWYAMVYTDPEPLGYGENPHQKAVKYSVPGVTTGIANARQLGGKPMSFNNDGDARWAWMTVQSFRETAVAIIKHMSPCGIATGADVAEAHRKAHACDTVSAFGGVIAANRPVSVEMAEQIVQVFTEVVAAPGYESGALEVLAAKENLRILEVTPSPVGQLEFRQTDGGLLVQTPDLMDQPGDNPANWTLVAGIPANEALLADAEFAWHGCRWVKSNGILLAADAASVGIGGGQSNRVDSCRDAVRRAGVLAEGCAAASDAFFPKPDGPRVLIEAGVAVIVEPGGSKGDNETIELCERYGVGLYFTGGTRHFAH
jgi:phosphoribosylaminoimidazolecarboxamide formyltransferase/IMP cyclohydrolase